jgi:hypothetical protein
MEPFLNKSLKQVIKKDKPTAPFSGTWQNQHGSTMTIQVDGNGVVSGSYKTTIGKPGDNEEFNLTGFATGDLVAFCVNFGKYGSITSWTGQHTAKKDGEHIQCMWHLAINIEDEEEEEKLWQGVWTGSDIFERRDQ